MEKKTTEIKNLKPGGFLLIEDVPYTVEKIQKSKAGKHGAAKARVFARGIFDGQKKIIVKPGGTKVDIPIMERKNMQVIAFIGVNAQLMDLTDYEQMELPIPEELTGKLVEGDEVLVWKYGRYAMIKSKK